MTEEQIARLRAMQDEEIDCSDTPPLVGPPARRLYGPRFHAKTEDLVVLEPDVVEFFRSTGELSAGRINAALRQYMEQQRKLAYVGA
jgi:uncharacterized protein (DUF4415 family)